MSVRTLIGDALTLLATLPAASVQTVVTSPPYWNLRDYGTAQWAGGDAACDHKAPPRQPRSARPDAHGFGTRSVLEAQDDGATAYRDVCRKCRATRVDQQIGLERTPEEYVEKLVAVFHEVKRVLRDDGTLWLNLGDSYTASGKSGDTRGGFNARYFGKDYASGKQGATVEHLPTRTIPPGLKPKDLVGIPWMVAFALRADGWYLRSDIIWHKPNPMPESVTDRPTKAHEYLFLLSKSERYYYDADAIRDPAQNRPHDPAQKSIRRHGTEWHDNAYAPGASGFGNHPNGRNRRSVWTVATQPFTGAHFATFPPKLIEPCILAGSSPQACEHCGAPWGRVTSRGDAVAPTFDPLAITQSGALPDGPGIHRNMGGRYQAWLDANPKLTVGWQPTCACEHNTGSARSVVLDPFGGAGTTGLVADRLGRDAVLIELNPEYAALAKTRVHDDAPLFSDGAA